MSVETALPIEFSDAAAAKVKALVSEEENPDLKLRVYVTGGGCSFTVFSAKPKCHNDLWLWGKLQRLNDFVCSLNRSSIDDCSQNGRHTSHHFVCLSVVSNVILPFIFKFRLH